MRQFLGIRNLNPTLFVAFDLQRFFSGILARKMPQALDQERVDNHFLDEICTLHKRLFSKDSADTGSTLHPYLVRYLIFFYDQDYQGSTLLDEFARQFMDRHRFFRPPPPRPAFSLDKACDIFGIPRDKRNRFTKKELTQRYRRLARTCHPDRGGTPEAFVALTNAFQRLIGTIA